MNKLHRILDSKRLILRPIMYSDVNAIFETWGTDEDVCRYTTWYAHKNISDTMYYVQKVNNRYVTDNEYMEWLVCLKETGKPFGALSLFCNANKEWHIGYNYAKEYWHNGYGSETLQTVLDFIFTHTAINEVYAEHFSVNINSGRVMKHCGMKYINSRTQTVKNTTFTVCEYKITKFDWLLIKTSTMDTIQTKHFLLRPLRYEDIDTIIQWFSDEDVTKYMFSTVEVSREGVMKKLQSSMERIVAGNYKQWVISERVTEKPIGLISLNIHDDGLVAHSSYVIAKERWGNNYATESLRAVRDYAFEKTNIYFLEASYAHPNVASGKVMNKAGLKCQGNIVYNDKSYGEPQMIECKSGVYPLITHRISRAELK